MAKSWVAPLKSVKIPRLEMTAALKSVKIGAILCPEIEHGQITEVFWTDSKVFIGHVCVGGQPSKTDMGPYITQSVEVCENSTESSRKCFAWPTCAKSD